MAGQQVRKRRLAFGGEKNALKWAHRQPRFTLHGIAMVKITYMERKYTPSAFIISGYIARHPVIMTANMAYSNVV